MAVPVELRNQAPSPAGTIAWIIAQLLALAFLYEFLLGQLGDGLVKSWFNIESASSEQIRWMAFSMCAIRTLSQIFWSVYILNYNLPPGTAVGITVFNLVLDMIMIVTMLANRTNVIEIDYVIYAVFLLGIALERVPEIQRTIWKALPENKGKPHTSGLFAVAVHMNYTGYIIWRFAMYAIALYLPIQSVTVFVLVSFVTGDIVVQKQRNIAKYGEEFKRYWDQTAKMFPGLY